MAEKKRKALKRITYADRLEIEKRLREHVPVRKIAIELDLAKSTVESEINRCGTTKYTYTAARGEAASDARKAARHNKIAERRTTEAQKVAAKLEAARQDVERVLRPMLDEVLDDDADKRVTIGDDENLYVGSVSLGTWWQISDIRADTNGNIHYRHKKNERCAYFGRRGADTNRTLLLITVQLAGGETVIYNSFCEEAAE